MNTAIAALLMDIEAELRTLGLWDNVPPSPTALASDQPFSIDTLTLPQWLQFVFLPTIYGLLEQGESLPGRCGIAPMAEQYFKDTELASATLEAALLTLDQLLSGEDSGQ